MEPKEEKLVWETPVIEDFDIVESTASASPDPPGNLDGNGYS
jgi:hypothetical protein